MKKNRWYLRLLVLLVLCGALERDDYRWRRRPAPPTTRW